MQIVQKKKKQRGYLSLSAVSCRRRSRETRSGPAPTLSRLPVRSKGGGGSNPNQHLFLMHIKSPICVSFTVPVAPLCPAYSQSLAWHYIAGVFSERRSWESLATGFACSGDYLPSALIQFEEREREKKGRLATASHSFSESSRRRRKLDLFKVFHAYRARIEKLSPQQLPHKRYGRLGVLSIGPRVDLVEAMSKVAR